MTAMRFFCPYFIVGILGLMALDIVAATGDKSCGTIDCDLIEIDIHDKVAIQRGAHTYVHYCLGCHSLRYMRYDDIVQYTGIDESIFEENLILDGGNIGDTLDNALDQDNAKLWFGIAPPDLTLVTRDHSPEWVYTFLRSFYIDETKQWKVNNKVIPNVAMPHVLYELQGIQQCANQGEGQDGAEKNDSCPQFTLLEEGSLQPQEFDATIADLVHFLVFVGEPYRVERERLGIYVLLFLSIMIGITWLLKREYWKDIHRS